MCPFPQLKLIYNEKCSCCHILLIAHFSFLSISYKIHEFLNLLLTPQQAHNFQKFVEKFRNLWSEHPLLPVKLRAT